LIFSHALSCICPFYDDHPVLDQDGWEPSRTVAEDKRRAWISDQTDSR